MPRVRPAPPPSSPPPSPRRPSPRPPRPGRGRRPPRRPTTRAAAPRSTTARRCPPSPGSVPPARSRPRRRRRSSRRRHPLCRRCPRPPGSGEGHDDVVLPAERPSPTVRRRRDVRSDASAPLAAPTVVVPPEAVAVPGPMPDGPVVLHDPGAASSRSRPSSRDWPRRPPRPSWAGRWTPSSSPTPPAGLPGAGRGPAPRPGPAPGPPGALAPGPRDAHQALLVVDVSDLAGTVVVPGRRTAEPADPVGAGATTAWPRNAVGSRSSAAWPASARSRTTAPATPGWSTRWRAPCSGCPLSAGSPGRPSGSASTPWTAATSSPAGTRCSRTAPRSTSRSAPPTTRPGCCTSGRRARRWGTGSSSRAPSRTSRSAARWRPGCGPPRSASPTCWPSPPVGVALFDDHERLVQANQSLCRLLGEGQESLRGRRADELLDLAAERAALARGATATGAMPLLARPAGSAGSISWSCPARALGRRERGALGTATESVWCELHVSVSVDDLGRATHLVVFTDVTENRRVEASLRHQAMHDELTGLPDRLRPRPHGVAPARRAQRAPHGGAVLRPRQLQAGQRLARPRRGRRAARGPGREAARGPAARLQRHPALRRRVRRGLRRRRRARQAGRAHGHRRPHPAHRGPPCTASWCGSRRPSAPRSARPSASAR